MLENIVFAILVIIAVSAGIWVWWLENHGTEPTDKTHNQEG